MHKAIPCIAVKTVSSLAKAGFLQRRCMILNDPGHRLGLGGLLRHGTQYAEAPLRAGWAATAFPARQSDR